MSKRPNSSSSKELPPFKRTASHQGESADVEEEPTFLIGARGSAQIRQAFSSEGPDTFVPSFSKTYGISGSLKAKLAPLDPLLKLFGVPVQNLLEVAIDRSCGALVDQVEHAPIDAERFRTLASMMLPYVEEDRLRDIPLSLFSRFPDFLTTDILEALAKPSVYEHCPLPVRRRLWLHDRSIHARHLAPLVQQYVEDPRIRALSRELRPIEYTGSLTSRLRKEHPTVRALATEIGDDVRLYAETLSAIRSAFVSDPDASPVAAMLRADILNALHDADVISITAQDQCHLLSWGLQPCIRGGEISARQGPPLRQTFKDIPVDAGISGVYGDVATLMCDPFATHLYAAHALQHLRRYALKNKHSEVRGCKELQHAALMITMGVHARRMFRTQDFRLPRIPKPVFVFLESMVKLLHIDGRNETADRPRHMRGNSSSDGLLSPTFSHAPPISPSSSSHQGSVYAPPRDGLDAEGVTALRSTRVAQSIFAQYVLDRLHHRDIDALSHLLPTVMETLPRELGGTGSGGDGEGDIGAWPVYEALAISIAEALGRTHIANLLSPTPRMRVISVERFLLPLARVSFPIHEAALGLAMKVCERSDKTAEHGLDWGRRLGEEGKLPPVENVKEYAWVKGTYLELLERSRAIKCELTPNMVPRMYNLVYSSSG